MWRWQWNFTYIRLNGKGILPDLVASIVASCSMFITKPWLGHKNDQIFMICFCAVLMVYGFSAQYYYKKVVLGIDNWDRRD
ncbi:hypothetical protein JCM8795_11750 [Hydrogenobaculum acidophilum]